jgi:hypothetical protein
MSLVPKLCCFSKRIGSGAHRMTQNSVGERGVSYAYAGEKRCWNSVPACVLVRQNFQNGVPACSITKIPLVLRYQTDDFFNSGLHYNTKLNASVTFF